MKYETLKLIHVLIITVLNVSGHYDRCGIKKSIKILKEVMTGHLERCFLLQAIIFSYSNIFLAHIIIILMS